MTTTTISADARCPDCGNGEAIVRVRGNAMSSVCTGCRRVDVGPMLDEHDLLLIEGELLEADLFTLDAVRAGQAEPLRSMLVSRQVIEDSDPGLLRQHIEGALQVELRMPVPPR